MPTKTLDLGCGSSISNYFKADILYGVDLYNKPESNIVKADLAVESIPFPDDYFDFVTAHDFIEHIPRLIYLPKASGTLLSRFVNILHPEKNFSMERRNSFIELMNEIYRVLKPGGKFFAHTPAYPNPQAFWDPTHVNIITEHTFTLYFDNVHSWGKMYGFKGAFKMVSQEWAESHLDTILEKLDE